MDNAASFYRLAPALLAASPVPLHILALDLAGHGGSDHRCAGQPSNIWQDVVDIFAVAEQLGWSRFALLGHSRGAIVSFLCAGTFPDRISQLALLDGLCPPPTAAAEAPAILATSVRDCLNPALMMAPRYQPQPVLCQAFQRARRGLDTEAAAVMAARNMGQSEAGFYWRTDPWLKTGSAVRFGRAQTLAFAAAIRAPLQLILASASAVPDYYQEVLEQLHQYRSVTFDGEHHLHLGAAAEPIAALLAPLLAAPESR
jgi:pimeloyl-ACP methyl ester carboxylesterase